MNLRKKSAVFTYEFYHKAAGTAHSRDGVLSHEGESLPVPEPLRVLHHPWQDDIGGSVGTVDGHSLTVDVAALDVQIDGTVTCAHIEWEGDDLVDGTVNHDEVVVVALREK